MARFLPSDLARVIDVGLDSYGGSEVDSREGKLRWGLPGFPMVDGSLLRPIAESSLADW